MQFTSALLASLAVAAAAPTYLLGQDVSSYQGSVDWSAQKTAGSNFAYIKATEGTTYKDSEFANNYDGAYKAGIIRGAYHFGHPEDGNGAAQAKYFIANGGGWSNDGKTLPGAIDLENGATSQCSGVSVANTVAFISDFGEAYKASEGRYPTIYTTTDWWNECTGDSKSFEQYPFWIAHYASALGSTPAGTVTSFWQFADSGKLAGDNDYWLGTSANLEKFAKNS